MTSTTRRTLLVLATAWSAGAFAHAVLTYPTPRTTNANMKAPPCGLNLAAPTSMATFQPGETVPVRWAETVNHPGYYVLDFGRNIDGGFDGGFTPLYQPDGGALNNIPNPAGTQAMNTAMVKLPTEPCPLCQIRMRQFMSDNASLWYLSCSDITIAGAPSTPDAGAPIPPPDAGTTKPDSGTFVPPADSGTPSPPAPADSGTGTGPGPGPGPTTPNPPAPTPDAGGQTSSNNLTNEEAIGCSSAGGSLLVGLGMLCIAATRRRRKP